MKNIYVNLENCYGIPKFKYTFEFNSVDKKAHLIYAPNGVMKTSFANTMKDICTDIDSKDCFYPERTTVRCVKFDDDKGIDLTKNDILVIEPYTENYKSENMSILLANEELKEEYERIHSEINEKMSKVFTILNNSSGKRGSEDILATDFDFLPKNIFECLETILTEYNSAEVIDFSHVKYRYGKLFTADSEKILADGTVISQLQSYIEQYEKLLSESAVFKAAFNHNSAEDVLKTLGKEGFFKANHKILLANSETSVDENEFRKTIAEEKARILDVALADEFKKIDDLLSSKAGTKALRDFIFENREIIPELIDLKALKKKIWISYLFKDLSVFQEAILNYQNNKRRLVEIVEIAKSQTSKWNEIVLQFNERFSNMPFCLDVANRDDVVLKSKLPSISFIYKDRGEETSVEEKDLILHLSNGEKKALYLLNILFELQARKEMGISTFLIMDDIADSFDYRNKYAIIEYIKDIVDYDLFMPVILTHNFDFYRTVAGRIEIKPTSHFVLKNNNVVTVIHGQYFENVFDSWRTNIYSNHTVFLSSIAFVRNLIEYIKGRTDATYINLTSLLHYKKNSIDGAMATEDIKNSDVMNWYCNEWGRDLSKFTQDPSQKTIDLLTQIADDIVSNSMEAIEIEKKIVLSIAIRLKTEKYMISRINDDAKINLIKGNQTRKLRDLIFFNNSISNDMKIQEIIERVLIITSENIHINSFMYEPIVDMSLGELIQLYNDVKTNL
ncbi:MAG: hypothetical protein VR72_08605 [Clostridiaceae bacterium BRH_c20a]|nr:MAG: hypothetical protein VR72_08605 [Clostridiaceae bacterium BRH_c20a]